MIESFEYCYPYVLKACRKKLPVNISECNEVIKTHKKDKALEDVIQEAVNMEVGDTVERDHDDQADTVVIIPPQEAALPGHSGEQRDVVTLAKHGHPVERGEQRERDGLEVSILASEQRDAATDRKTQKVG